MLGFLIHWGGIRLNLGVFFKWTSLFILLVAAGPPRSDPRLPRGGPVEPVRDTAFDLSNVLSTHTLFGTLLEGIFGYQETPSVSEVAVYLLYLIPALVLFALPPRNNTTASRAA